MALLTAWKDSTEAEMRKAPAMRRTLSRSEEKVMIECRRERRSLPAAKGWGTGWGRRLEQVREKAAAGKPLAPLPNLLPK